MDSAYLHVEGEKIMKRIVVFYSRAGENYFEGQFRYVEKGNTQKVAEIIAAETGADLYQIQQKVPYASDYKTCVQQAKTDWKNNVRPELAGLPENFEIYDEVYLGYPNYCGNLPMAVYTFIEALRWEGKTVYPFCTHEGSGLSGTEEKIAEVCKGAQIKEGFAVHGSHIDESREFIVNWIRNKSHEQ